MTSSKHRTMDETAAFRRAVAQLGGPAAGGSGAHGKGEGSGSHGSSGRAAILPPVRARRRRSPFAEHSLELRAATARMHRYLLALRADYLQLPDPTGARTPLTDAQCDQVDRAIAAFVRSQSDAIAALRAGDKGGPARPDDLAAQLLEQSGGGDNNVHRLAVQLFLTEQLARLDRLHKSLRQQRVMETLARRALTSLEPAAGGAAPPSGRTPRSPTSSKRSGGADGPAKRTVAVTDDEFTEEERQLYALEDPDLYQHLTATVTEIRGAWSKRFLARLSARCSKSAAWRTLSSHTLSARRSRLSTSTKRQSVASLCASSGWFSITDRVKAGNVYLQQAKQSSSGIRRFILLFLIVMTLALLFLDWYD